MVGALIKDRMRPGLVLLSAATVFVVAGILPVKDLLDGFSNKGMLTVALLFLVSEGVRRSGILERAVRFMLPQKERSVCKAQGRFLPMVAVFSAFLNNTPIVVILAPIVKRWADVQRLPATKFLIPLSYATILGGVCTLIGTSTNLVVHGLMVDAGFPGFTMFELGKVGLFVALFGLLYIFTIGTKLLPEQRLAESDVVQRAYNRVEVVLGARFPGIGKRVSDYPFKEKYGASPIELHRGGILYLMHDMRRIYFREGDTLILAADDDFMANWRESSFFLMVSDGKTYESRLPKWKSYAAFILLIIMISGAALGELPIVQTLFPSLKLDMFFFALVVTVIMAWLNLFPARKYTKYISWDILITIASSFAISKALMQSGVADLVAQGVMHVMSVFGNSPLAPYVMLAIVFVITDLTTELITNNAAAALSFPLSLSIAQQMQVDPMPFFVTICMAASASFSTPIGYQTNLIVQGVGGYHFKDFVRVGLPMNLIALVVTVAVVPLFWSF